jgi:hypothetical protein
VGPLKADGPYKGQCGRCPQSTKVIRTPTPSEKRWFPLHKVGNLRPANRKDEEPLRDSIFPSAKNCATPNKKRAIPKRHQIARYVRRCAAMNNYHTHEPGKYRRAPFHTVLGVFVFGALLSTTVCVNEATAAETTVDPRPRILNVSIPAAEVGERYSHKIASSGSPASYRAFGLPPEFAINFATGVIEGIPTTSRTVTINIIATNSAGSHSTNLALVIAPARPRKN